MRLNVKKSAVFFIKPRGNRSYSQPILDRTEGRQDDVPPIEQDESVKYLGSKVSPWTNKIRQDVRLEEMLKGIDAASLKPRQKLVLLQLRASKDTISLTQTHIPKGKLQELDVTVRTYLKTIVDASRHRTDID